MSPSADPVTSEMHGPTDYLGNPKHPFSKTWRGSEDGAVRLDGIPKFDDLYAEREWIKEHMAAVFRFWGKMGYGDGVAGHITVRDPVLPGHYWMNPIAVHYSSMTKSKLVLVNPEGYVSPHGAQLPINAAGFFIHSAIHKARPDIHAAAHCHSLHGKAWSVFGKPVEITTQDSCALYDNHTVYENFGGVVLATEEGENIARALGPKHKTCILQNHGLLTLGHTVDEAAQLFTTLDKQCQVQLLVERASANNNIQRNLIDREDAAFSAKIIQDPHVMYLNFQPEYQLLIEETNGAFLK
ncbi:arad-like aldolase/epimerase [Lyophyllum atratum]|nr:arad-like aldolase/epimerase [Lyophyllum atratum]